MAKSDAQRRRQAEPVGRSRSSTDASHPLGRDQVIRIQKARLLVATGQVACEHGAGNLTVAQVVKRAGVSRRTFYEVFADAQDSLFTALHEALQRVRERVLDAWSSEGAWRERARSCLVELLSLFDEDPVLARLLVVESLGAGPRVLEERLHVLDALTDALDESASREAGPIGHDTRLSAEGAIGGALGVLYARISRGSSERLVELVGPFMSMLVLPYHGAAAARRELSRPVSLPADRREDEDEAVFGSNPFKDAGMRLTYRTTYVLNTIAENPGSSNRQIGELAQISDQGQVSKLLARLERIGMIVNDGERKGEPNVWSLTPDGRRLMRNLDFHAEHAQDRGVMELSNQNGRSKG